MGGARKGGRMERKKLAGGDAGGARLPHVFFLVTPAAAFPLRVPVAWWRLRQVDDHLIMSYLAALRAARATLAAGLAVSHAEREAAAAHPEAGDAAGGARKRLKARPPAGRGLGNRFKPWKPFSGAAACAQCEHDFCWESTSSSAAQRLMDMHHCRECGGVVSRQSWGPH